MRDEGRAFVLIIQGDIESQVEQEEILSDVQTILDEFCAIIPGNIPSGLPSLQDIQHQIDLVLGVSLPNLPHYRLSPHENQIVREQVEKFLERGFIRGCSVPVL